MGGAVQEPVSVKLWKLIHLYWHFWTFLGEVSSKIPQLCHISPQWVRPDSKFIFHYIDQDDYNELLTILLVEMSKHKQKMCPLVICWRRVSFDNMVNWTLWVDHFKFISSSSWGFDPGAHLVLKRTSEREGGIHRNYWNLRELYQIKIRRRERLQRIISKKEKLVE